MISRRLLRAKIAFIALGLAALCRSQTYTIGDIWGTVTIRYFDASGNPTRGPNGAYDEAAQGFIVIAVGDTYSATAVTSVKGDFHIYNLKSGTWHVQALKRGFLQTCPDNANLDVKNCPVIATLGTDKTQEEVPDPLHMRSSGKPPVKTHAQIQPAKLLLAVYRTVEEDGEGTGAQNAPLAADYSGETLDENRRPIPGSQVSLYAVQRDSGSLLLQDITTTNEKGRFLFAATSIARAFSTGDLVITITKSGYAPVTSLIQSTGAVQTLVLHPSQSVAELQSATSNKTEAARGKDFFSFEMQSLPIPDIRTPDKLALLLPGVAPAPQYSLLPGVPGPSVSVGIGSAGQFSVNGFRARNNNFTVDGSDNNEQDVGVRRQGYVTLMPQSIESLQEFQVITLLADARFGRNLGAQVNAISASGTRDFHGVLYGFGSSDLFNARDFFDETGGPSLYTLHRASDGATALLDGNPFTVANQAEHASKLTHFQSGFAVGGPISRKTGTYFFLSFENQTIHALQQEHFVVPTIEERGIFNTGATGLAAQPGLSSPSESPVPDQLYPASVRGDAWLSFFPFPNDSRGPYGANTYTTMLPANGQGNIYSGKLDQEIGSSNRLTVRYNLSRDYRDVPVTNDAIYSSVRPATHAQNVSVLLTSAISANATNTARFSYGRTHLTFGTVSNPDLLPSERFPTYPFLLNKRLIINGTLGPSSPPTFFTPTSPEGNAIVQAFGNPSRFTTEEVLGPIGEVEVAGFSPVGVDVSNFPQTTANNTFQWADTLTTAIGRHTISLGIDARRTQINSRVDQGFRPVATFNSLLTSEGGSGFSGVTQSNGAPVDTRVLTAATLAAGDQPTGYFQALAAVPDSTLGARLTQIEAFTQDQFRVNSGLYLIFGLRYAFNALPSTVGHRLEKAANSAIAFAQQAQQGALCETPCPTLVQDLQTLHFTDLIHVSFGNHQHNFAPRVGFAWSPSSSRTVIRGGYGIYYDQFLGILINQSRSAFPNFVSGNFNASFSHLKTLKPFIIPNTLNSIGSQNPFLLLFPKIFSLNGTDFGVAPGLADPILTPSVPGYGLVTPYSQQFGITIQRQFPHDLSASIAYVGTRGTHLLNVTTPFGGANNATVAHPLSNGRTSDARFVGTLGQSLPILGASLFFPAGGKLVSEAFGIAPRVFDTDASSTYHSLQVELIRRYSSGVQFSSAFTYSHSIDNASDFFDNEGSFALPQDSANPSERGSSTFDVRLRSTTNFVWDLPFMRNSRWGGFSIAGVVIAQTGEPFTVNTSIDMNADGNLTDRLNTIRGLMFNPAPNDKSVVLALAPGVDPLSLLAPEPLNVAQLIRREFFHGRNVVLHYGPAAESLNDGAVGRNTFRSRGLADADIVLSKSTRLFHEHRLITRFEVYNLFNHPNFGIPVRFLEEPGFGRSVSTITLGRTLQLGIKYSF
jgi:hypothetical protein